MEYMWDVLFQRRIIPLLRQVRSMKEKIEKLEQQVEILKSAIKDALLMPEAIRESIV